jgi:serine/threonine protein kinase
MNLKHRQLLAHLGVNNIQKLGQGMQGTVYEYSPDQVIKIWSKAETKPEMIKDLHDFYQQLNWNSARISVPEVHKYGEYQGIYYTIEKKFKGQPAHLVYEAASNSVRKELLDNYFHLLGLLRDIEIEGEYGSVISGTFGKNNQPTWTKFLKTTLERTKDRSLKYPDHGLENIEQLFEKYYLEVLPTIDPNHTKNFVHGDLFLENVLASANGEITALLDFGPLAAIGDHLMDVAGLVHFVTVSKEVDEGARDHLLKLAMKEYPGQETEINNYLLFSSLQFINSKTYDPRTYEWCIRNLTSLGYL